MRTATIEDALEDDNWTVFGKLVGKRSFERGPGKENILLLVFVDDDGDAIELKSYSGTKTDYMYGRVDVGEHYTIKGYGNPIEEANEEYSPAAYQFDGDWKVYPNHHFETESKIKCTGSLYQGLSIAHKRGSVNLIGYYVHHRRLRKAYKFAYDGEEPYVKGYLVKLEDKYDIVFYVSVWHTTQVDDDEDFDLFQCEQGDQLLFLAARVDDYPSAHDHKFKTVYNPVLIS